MEPEQIVGVVPGALHRTGIVARTDTLLVTNKRLIAVPVNDMASLMEARDMYPELTHTDDPATDITGLETRAHIALAQRLRRKDLADLLSRSKNCEVFEPAGVRSVKVSRYYSWPRFAGDRLAHIRIDLDLIEAGKRAKRMTYKTESEYPAMEQVQTMLTSLFGSSTPS
jgi:hypothetical protein